MIGALACLAVTACESGYSSGVDRNKPANSLTADEARRACESLNDYIDAQLPQSERDRFNCTAQALAMVTVGPDGCRSMVEACLAAPPAGPLTIPTLVCSAAVVDPTCSATVGETETCITADLDAYIGRVNEVNCSIAGNIPALTELMRPVPIPRACSDLGASCTVYADGVIDR